MSKKYKHFTQAFKEFSGKEWEWVNRNGETCHPKDSEVEKFIAKRD